MRARSTLLVGVLVFSALALTACNRPVQVSPTPVANDRLGCPRLLTSLPEYVDGAKRRTITPTTASAAAWGRIPIVLTCGVRRPAALTATSELLTVNGVDWFGEPLSKGYRFTTFGRAPRLQVDVPNNHSPESNALVDLAGAVKKGTIKAAETGLD